MKRILLALLFSTSISLGSDTLKQQLTKRTLRQPPPAADQTLSQALAALSADYQMHYHEPLRIYLAVDLVKPHQPQGPQPPLPKIPGLEPVPESDSVYGHTDTGHFRAPVVASLRYFTELAGVAFTIRDDMILIHAKRK